MAKTTANSIPTETARSSKATLQGKSKQKKGTWYRSCDRCVGCGIGGALSQQVE